MSTDASDRFAALELDIPGSSRDTQADLPVITGPGYTIANDSTSLQEMMERVPELAGTVTKEPLYTLDGMAVPNAYASIRRYTAPGGHKVIQSLGVVGERYQVVQDREAFDIVGPLMEAGILKSLNAGAYRAKTWVYGQAGVDPIEVVPGDAIEARILIGNSHDGSIPWAVGWPGNRVVCQNTFHMAMSSKASKLLRLRHSGNVVDLISRAKAAIAEVGMEFVTTADKFKYLASKPCNKEQLKEYTGYVFSKWADTDDETTVEAAGGRVYNRIVENFENGPGSEYARGTAWNAYNAVTQFLTHERGRGNAEARFADLQWGNGAGLSSRALTGALQLAGA